MTDPVTDPVTHPVSRRWLLLLSAAGIALPFLLVSFPPMTDLPQHTAQVRLLLEALRDPEGIYRIQWLTPYWGVYGLLAAAWAVVGPENAGRLGALLLCLIWAGALHAVSWRRARAPEAAVLASLLVFNHTLYWGFGTFLAGWPAYLLWLQLIASPTAPTRKRWLLLLFSAGLLYWCHILWFAAGAATLGAVCLVQRKSWRSCLVLGSVCVPFVLVAAWWYPQLAQRGFKSGTHWFNSPLQRLSPSGLTNAAFGGLKDSIEGPVLAALVLWMLVGLWQHRRELRERVDRVLLTAGLLLFAFSMVLPDKSSNTIYLATRWMPGAIALLLLALPTPRLPVRSLRVIAGALTALLVGFTALAWRQSERTELAGLEEALEALPQKPRVLGLDFLQQSRFFSHRPFMQLHAYAQVWRGGQLNFSFADFAPSPVVFKQIKPPPWSNGLEWYPWLVKPSDFKFFDYVLLGALDEGHERFVQMAPVVPVTASGNWRLYRIERGRSAPKPPG
jgi:hypothetical protein